MRVIVDVFIFIFYLNQKKQRWNEFYFRLIMLSGQFIKIDLLCFTNFLKEADKRVFINFFDTYRASLKKILKNHFNVVFWSTHVTTQNIKCY